MFGDVSTPLHHPEPRRRDRRGGRRSARLGEALRRPTGGRQGSRPEPEKRRALKRQGSRLSGEWSGIWLARLGALALVAAIAYAAFATASQQARVPYAEAPAEYARLAEVLAAICPDRPCGWGWGLADRPPAEARRLMAPLRVRRATHDPVAGRTMFYESWHEQTVGLVYDHPGPPTLDARRARYRAWLAERDSIDAAPGRVVEEPLGGGWYRVMRR